MRLREANEHSHLIAVGVWLLQRFDVTQKSFDDRLDRLALGCLRLRLEANARAKLFSLRCVPSGTRRFRGNRLLQAVAGVGGGSSRLPGPSSTHKAVAQIHGWRAVAGDLPQANQFDQVSADRKASRAVQHLRDVDIDGFHDLMNAGVARFEPSQDRRRSLPPVFDERANIRLGLENRRAMRRQINRVVAMEQFDERVHIRSHVSVRRNDHARGPAHHVVSGEEHALLVERKGKMVGGMTRGVHRCQLPARSHEHVAVAHGFIHFVAVDFRSAGALDRIGRRPMVRMSVCDQNVLDRFAAQ